MAAAVVAGANSVQMDYFHKDNVEILSLFRSVPARGAVQALPGMEVPAGFPGPAADKSGKGSFKQLIY
jgi:hypothetical protein